VTNALFTAVSAVCVTGLTVVDTPAAFTSFGKAAILLLIQVGGLGIMSFYAVALRVLGRRMSLRHELSVAGTAGLVDSVGCFVPCATCSWSRSSPSCAARRC
jgi:trk system potassium uptake protein TrkH